MIFCIGGGNVAFAEEEKIDFSEGSYSETDNQIVWSGTSCTITQAQGSSTTKPNSSYISAPRWYASHVISFSAKENYTISSVTVVATSGSYANVFKNSTFSNGASATVSSSTVTITTNGDFTITMSAQSRISSVTVTYTASGGSTEPNQNTLTLTPATTTLAKATDITMSATIDGTKIYYTTDSTEPSASSTLYEGAFKVTQSGTTVKAVAIAEGYDNVTAEATYTIKPDQPVFSDESKLFKDAFDVTLSLPETTDATSTIHYAIGSTATAESDVYTGAINISSETDGDKIILHAVVVDEYGNVGTEKYCTYTKTTSIVFDFTQRPNVWNIEPVNYNKDGDSNVAGKDLAVDGIVMTSTNGDSYITCIYATTSDPNLRVYTGGTITFTAPEGYNLSEIKFTGSSLGNFECYTDHYSNSTWIGNAHAVTFTASGSVQVKTASIKIVPASSEVPTDVTLHVGDALYSTLYYSDRALVVPENTEAYTYTVTNGQLKESYRYDENKTIPAGVGVVVFALEAGDYTFAVSSQAGDVDEDNMLKGSDEDELTVGGDVYYKLSLNEDNEAGTIGFYWGAEGGAAFTNKAHKAYLALTKDAAGAAKSFLLDGTTNGIGNISVEKTMNTPLYNISGQRVGKSYKGMVISNGKKYIQK